ncbi:hypothetical protein [Longimicrobium sp.]|jgi:hypothetical protein|uniref:hypothetical protein n=1 Tax=Longimicrobium sp. TaxID=2029185 RepID=UPI002EDA058C
MPIVVWRDSVAMGDDVDAPHEWSVPLASDTSIGALVEAVLRAHYLASVASGHATWIVEGARPLAVVAQEWAAPRWLVAPELPAAALARPGRRPEFQVRYWGQVDPGRVYDYLQAGEPLPDPYER